MKLPFKLPGILQKKEEKDYFLELLLREEKITAVIFEESQGRIHIVGHDEEYFPDTLNNTSEEGLLDVADKAISKAEETVPDNVETQKTIFGLQDDWVHETQIKKDRLPILKKISEALGLTPIGFLVNTEAVAHLLEKDEGAPVSAVLLEVSRKHIQISLLRAGRVIETKTGLIEDSIITSTDKLLHHFVSHEILPSRIIVQSDENADELSQELISHTWSRSLPFLHVPQITTLTPGFDAKAVLFGAASQMGFEVSHFDMPKKARTLMPKLDDLAAMPKKAEAPKMKSFEIDNEEELEEMSEATASAEEKPEEETRESKTSGNLDEPESTREVSGDNDEFGFMSGADIALSQPQPKAGPQMEEKSTKQTDRENPLDAESFISRRSDSLILPNMPKRKYGSFAQSILGTLLGLIPVVLTVVSRAFSKVSKGGLSLPSLSFPRGSKIVLIPPLVLIVLIGFILFYIFGRSADVTLLLSPKTVDQTDQVTFASDKPTDPANKVIAAQPVSVSEDGTATTQATGTKEVGDKAKGSVTIYSISSSSQSFPAGTTITGPNNLAFTFDDAVTVASASGSAFTGIQPSTAKVNVTAKDIGKEYNLPSGTTFTIDSQTSAKNDSAFSGGSKQEVTVVSKADVDKLTSQLPNDLSDKAKSDLSQKAGGGTEVLSLFTKTSFDKKQLSKNIGDQASSVTLTGTVDFETMSFTKSDLMTLVKNTINNQTSNMNIPDDLLSYDVKDITAKSDSEAVATIDMKGALLPLFDTNQLADQIKGKSTVQAEDILRSLPQVSSVQISIHPNIPLLPKNLPGVSKKISFKVTH